MRTIGMDIDVVTIIAILREGGGKIEVPELRQYTEGRGQGEEEGLGIGD
jgi:hypothetical protein